MNTRYSRSRLAASWLFVLATTFALAQEVPELPPVIRLAAALEPREDASAAPAWVAMETAFSSSAPLMGPGAMQASEQLVMDDPEVQDILRRFGEGGDLSKPRGPDGECRFSRTRVGYDDPPALRHILSEAGVVVAGELEAKEVGYLYGSLNTYYALRVDQVLRSLADVDLAGKVLWVRHDGVDAEVAGREICYRPRSWPHYPSIGRRAIATLRLDARGHPRLALQREGEGPEEIIFASDWLLFERPDGVAYLPGSEKVVAGQTWEQLERRVARIAERLQ